MLELAELPPPEPAAGEVLVRVARAGVNFGDTHQREGQYVAERELPFVPGGEVAGTVERAGPASPRASGWWRCSTPAATREFAAVPAGRLFSLPDAWTTTPRSRC